MSGFKLIKTIFEEKKAIVACNFNESFNYYTFIEIAKKTHNISALTLVDIFNCDFIIKPEFFPIIIEQYIDSVDFIVQIKLKAVQNATTTQSVCNTDFNIFLNDVVETVNLPKASPSDECTFFTDIEFENSSSQLQTPKVLTEEIIYSTESIYSDLPSTQEIRKLFEVQEAIQANIIENKHRTNIAKAIISLILKDNPDKKIIREDFLQLSQSIVDIISSEEKETYYVPFTHGHLAKGKLYDAYNNKRSRLSAAGIIRRRPKSKPEEALTAKRRFVFKEDANNIQDNDLDILKLENYSDWSLVLQKWEKSHIYRQQELEANNFTTAEYLFKYKILSNARSYELINIDFNILYPKAKQISEWKKFYLKLINKSKKLKDLRVQEILQHIKATNDEDPKVALSLMLIPYHLPNCRQQNKGEIQQSFIYYCKNILTADDEIRARVKRLQIETQPKIYFIGDSSKTICMAFVEVCGKRIKFENPLQAVDMCFKLFMAINIKYPKYCSHVWLFIQKIIFDVKTPWDTIIPSVNTLIKDLSSSI